MVEANLEGFDDDVDYEEAEAALLPLPPPRQPPPVANVWPPLWVFIDLSHD
jgi:hypothetical protein